MVIYGVRSISILLSSIAHRCDMDMRSANEKDVHFTNITVSYG